MKLSINQSELSTALSTVQKGLSSRPSLPILAGVYLKAKADELIFQTTDLELSIQYKTAALVEEEGEVVIPGKLVGDIVKNLPDAAVHIESAEDSAVISCDSASFSIRCMDAFDFPSFPEMEASQTLEVPGEVFSRMARKVCRVVSRDESRAILTGVLLSAQDNSFKMVATDSYRLAVNEAKLSQSIEESFEAVISGAFIADIAALQQGGSDVSIGLSENQVLVQQGSTAFVNRRIEGSYPNYKQLLPSSYETRCLVDRKDLLAAVKRASVLDHNSSQIKFDLDPASQTIQLNTQQESGSTQEIVKAEIEGLEVQIGFNSHYMAEGLNALESDIVSFEIQGPAKPGILRGSEEEAYLYLIMPVRI